MNTNVNLAAPLGAIALLGTGMLFLIAALLLIQSLIVKRQGRAKVAVLAMLVIVGAYVGAILVFSFASTEKVLARGAEKHFCEIDCHLAYSIVKTTQSKNLGDVNNQSNARGMYTVVTIKTRFDEDTIGPQRGNGQLFPNSRVLTLVDERGNRYSPSAEGERALQASQSAGTALTTPLRPSESYTTDVAFDLPPDMKAVTLLINEGELLTHLVIGHENSSLHKRTKFQL
jgi:hypothetical protein